MGNGLQAEAPADSLRSARWLTNAMRHIAKSYSLTGRETEIAKAVILGLSNKEIASRCAITEQTVKDHLRHIYLKAGVHQRTALMARVLGLSTKPR